MKKLLLLCLTIMCASVQLSAQTAPYAQVEITNTTGQDMFVTLYSAPSTCSSYSSVTVFLPGSGAPATVLGSIYPGVRFVHAIVTDVLPSMASRNHVIFADNPGLSPPACSPSGTATCDSGFLDFGVSSTACWFNINDPTASSILITP